MRYYPEVEGASSNALKIKNSKAAETETIDEASGTKISKPNIAKVRTLEETTGTVAVMNLVVVPWGEIFLDGRMQGISPPLLELQVAPGKHEIEIRNAKLPVYKQTIQAKVGEKIKINHNFAN